MWLRRLSEKERKNIEGIFKLPQRSILSVMNTLLKSKYGEENVIYHRDFLIAKGDIPVGIVAHADTVHTALPKEIFYDKENNVMWSPEGIGADDRAGIYAIICIVNTGLRPHIIITTDEEYGCLGASKCTNRYPEFPGELKFLVELDRRGYKDSVFYECDNPEFEDYVNKFGFETNWGTMSDISVLAPDWGVAAVNLSIGYLDEHSKVERLYVGAMYRTIGRVITMLHDVVEHPEMKPFEYIESQYYQWYNSSARNHYRLAYSDWWDTPAEPDGHGQKNCCFCGEKVPKDDAYLVHWEGGGSFYLCNECFSGNYEFIKYCNTCNKAYYATSTKPGPAKDWKCIDCKEKAGEEVTVSVE